ncbi:MAG TPA: secondary thiamine-phosphate synthase enzyme YjbQ [Acidobacteriota bacterium]|nr:secondary thiamine-phosphate synthase enzyme YjbQ [Acidobacteriota bacterium]
MQSFSIRTQKHTQFIDITSEVQAAASGTGCQNGIVTVFVPHTTTGVTINENADPSVPIDIDNALERIVPWRNQYMHSEGNAAAHVKASLMGSSLQVILENGKLMLGPWQAIFFCEFDGPRMRKYYIAVYP